MDERTEENLGIIMKGVMYRVRYVDSVMDFVHGEYYDTNIIYIPEIEVTINHKMINHAKEDYTKEINNVVPTKLQDVEIDDDDIEKIQTIVHVEKVKKNLIKKYLGKGDEI